MLTAIHFYMKFCLFFFLEICVIPSGMFSLHIYFVPLSHFEKIILCLITVCVSILRS